MTFHADLPHQADISARLAPIRAHFLGTLTDRRERLATFCAEPVPVPDPATVRQLQEDSHKIRGVALTLGFDALGRAAGLADEALSPWHKAIEPLPMAATIVALLNDLLAEIDRAVATQP